MPMVSVIIPIYNTGPWLEECLNSVLNQTLTDIEIICIDDASKDNSLEIVKRYALVDQRINIITLDKNRGQSYARNIGIKTACGEYIYFLDSDDYIAYNAIKDMYQTSISMNLDILYFDAEPVFEDEKYKTIFESYLFHRTAEHYQQRVYKGSELLEQFLIHDEWTCSMPRQFIKRSLIKENNLLFQEGRIHEDELYAMQCALTANRVSFSPRRFFYRRFRSNSTMTKTESASDFIGYFSAVWYMSKLVHAKNCYTQSIQAYIAKMSNKTLSLYEKYNNDIDKEIITLKDEELLNAYYFYKTQQDIYCAYGNFSDVLINRIKKYKYIYVYGAGLVARSVYQGLIKRQVVIDGFIVTNRDNNPLSLGGHKVLSLDEFTQKSVKDKSIVIIAIRNHIPEIQNNLERLGIVSIEYSYTDKEGVNIQ